MPASSAPVSQQRPPEASPQATCGQKISVPALAGVWHVCVMPASGGFDNEEITRCDTRDTHSSTSGFCGSARGGCKTISHEPFSTPHSSTGTTFLAQGAALSCVSRVCSAVAQLTPVGQVHSCIHNNVCVCMYVFVCVYVQRRHDTFPHPRASLMQGCCWLREVRGAVLRTNL